MLSSLEAGVEWSGKVFGQSDFRGETRTTNRSEGRRGSRAMAFQTEGPICADPEARESTL